MMHGHEKSDPAIVAVKPTNKAERSAAELVERRAGTKGNADQQSTHRTQSRARVSQALGHIRKVFAVTHPRWEPYAGKPHVRIWAGARGNSRPYRERSLCCDCSRRVMCRFSDAGNDDLATRSGGRRPKSAKARNRVGKQYAGGAAAERFGKRLWGFGDGSEAG
jgi:hypothetical protein